MEDPLYLLPPEVWRFVCSLLDEPLDTERDKAEMLATAVREHPVGHGCPVCRAFNAARAN